MPAWSDHDLSVDGITIHYYRMGTPGKPVVILLHGFTDSGLAWTRLANDLAPDYDLVMIDAVGHGRSGGPEHGFRSRAVSDVIAVIDALGLTRPALVGHSMGAATAAGVAAEAGDRIRAIVLEDPPWRDPEAAPATTSAPGQGSRAPIGSPEWVEWNRAFKELSPEERRARAATERPTWADEDRIPWVESKAQFNLDVIAERNAPRPAWQEEVSRITCPILLITADPERGGIVTPEVANEAAGLWRQGKIAHVPGAGHNIRREQWEPFRAAVLSFLKETV